MQINSTTTRDTSNAIGSAIQQSTGSQELGQQAFLKLLTTQLSNQDPLAPQDQQQMLAQLAQFSTVEGVNNLQSSQTHLQAANLLGKTVNATTVVDNTPQTLSGKVSSVRWSGSSVYLTLDDANKSEVTLDQVATVTE